MAVQADLCKGEDAPASQFDIDVDVIPVGLLAIDDSGQAIAANHEWTELSGLSVDGSLGVGWLSGLVSSDRRGLRRHIQQAAAGGAPSTADYLVTTGTTTRWLRFRVQHHAAAGDPARIVLAVSDVSEDRARLAELVHRATHDALTGLLNRDMGMAFIERAVRRLARHPGTVAVVFVDLDGFKAVNDHGGHRVGDEVLVEVATRLRGAVRPHDVVARVGGDEFVVVSEDLTSQGDVAAVRARIQAAFTTPIQAGGVGWEVGASVGVAVAAEPSARPEALLAAADRAMYEAKPRRSAPSSSPASNPGDLREPATADDLEAVVSVLRDVSHRLAGLATADGGHHTVHILDAADAACRALTALAGVQHASGAQTA